MATDEEGGLRETRDGHET